MDKFKEQLLQAVLKRELDPMSAMDDFVREISREIGHGRITTDQAREQVISFRQSAFTLAVGKF